MFASRVRRFAVLCVLALAARPALAQGGSIGGKVTTEGGTPLNGVRVQAINASGQMAASVLSRDDGTYRVANVAAGTYTVVASRIGYTQMRTEGVSVTAGGAATVNFTMKEIATELNPVVTTASRRPEKALAAPASVSVVDVRDIQERPSVTVTDHVRGIAGVDVNQGGIAQSNVVARGFNNAFSGSILMLQDYRFAGVPSLRVNVPFLMTGTNEDVERIEVLLGPASALYGPNSANGVLHVITKSPFSSQGTTLTVDGGNRSLIRGSLRHAGLITPKVGYKLSGEYFSATDWSSPSAHDTLGNVLPNSDPGEPDVFPAEAPASRRGKANIRDFGLRRFTSEARLDIRPSDNSEFVTTLGYTDVGSGLELTGANGTAQIKNWTYKSLQQRARIGRLFGQVFLNLSDAGNDDSLSTSGTYLLRSGQPIVDQSRVFAAQLQHGLGLGSKQDFVYGLDLIKTNPRTGGTINGRNESIDDVTEVGGYLQSTTNLTSKLDFIAALRVDHNSLIDGYQTSPRLALVFKPTETHNFRVTYNRAFSTPANFSYFLDLIQARNIGNSGYNIRALGNPPKAGWSFNRTCGTLNGGLCMKSRFSGGNNWVASSAAGVYRGVITGLRANLIALLTPSLGAANATALVGALGNLQPTDAQVGTRVAYLNQATNPARDIQNGALADIGPLDASYNKTYELGYKGIIGNKLRLAIDGWVQKRGDVGNPAGLATPNVFFNGQTLGAYLGPNIVQILMGAGMPQAQAVQAAAQIAPAIATAAAQLPLGIVQFNNDTFANGTDVYATYTSSSNKEITVKGVDMAVDFVANEYFTFAGTYSWVSDLIFSDIVSSNSSPLMLNAPDGKASFTVKYRNEPRRYGAEFRWRYMSEYPVNSGVYAAGPDVNGKPMRFQRPGSTQYYIYDGVPTSSLIDLGFNYRLPFGAQEVMWSLNGTNVLDKKVRSFPGSPQIGRQVVTRLQYNF
ncbi:MAG: TonB-dependent receptor [Gemmatimonadaceae bacterium]|nr:TonB-dependent receptor [Gemmatimonadaceae bacterium]